MKKRDYIISILMRFTNVFGSNTDWINQHTVFPEYLRNMFYETGKLIPNFSLNYGGGQNLYNISYYGLLSPIILPSYLMPHISMVTYMTITNILIVLVSIYLFYKWLKNNKYETNIVFITTLLFALSEALIFQMHRHIMFVNYMPFLILSLISVDSLLEKNKKTLFVLSIFLMIMTSYYYSVGGILVVGTYFIYKYVKIHKEFNKTDFIKELIKIISLGLLAVLMSFILLLPTIYTLFVGRMETDSTTSLIKLFIPYHKVHRVISGTYAIGYQLIGFISLLYLFFTKKKENITLATIISIVLFIPIFRYLLNGGLYLREKCFIPYLPLMGMIIAYFLTDLFKNKIDIKKFIILLLIITIPLFILNKFNIYYLYIFLFIPLLLYYKKYNNIKVFSSIILLTALVFCTVQNLREDTVTIKEYNEYFSNNQKETINKIIDTDNTFYRITNLMYPIKTVNKIYNPKQYTTSFYSSTYNGDYLNFIRNVFKTNNPDFNYFFASASDNTLFNTFMGVKYVYSPYDIGLGYDKLYDEVYINNNALPIMYHSTNLISEEDFNKLSYPYTIETLLNNTIVNTNTSYTTHNNIKKVNLDYEILNINKDNISIEKNENNNITINVKEDDKFTIKLKEPLHNKLLFINLYDLNRNGCDIGNTYININNIKNIITCYSWIYHNKNEVFHYLISTEDLEELNIEIGKGKYNISDIETYILDYNDIKDVNKKYKEFNIEEIKDDYIKGNIEVNEDGYFVTSIPYDKGFKVLVNNSEIEYEKVNTAFIGFKLNKGKYVIELKYNTPLLKEGKIITLITSIIFIILFIIEKKKLNN